MIRHSEPTPAQVADWFERIISPETTAELRALNVGGKGRTYSGFFDFSHLHEMAECAAELSAKASAVYFTLNPVSMERLAQRIGAADIAKRTNRAVFAKQTAKDDEIVSRRLLLIDADPKREGTVSATDAEKATAWEVIQAVRSQLDEWNWPQPFVADSGNGYHLLYRIDLPADDDGVVKRCLEALNKLFGTESAKIDTSVFNPSRICKFYGTWGRKGENTPERPHRVSQILELPDEPEVVTRELLQCLADRAPQPAAVNSSSTSLVVRPIPTPRDNLLDEPLSPASELIEIRARQILQKIGPAIEGNDGSSATWGAFQAIAIGLEMPDAQLWPLIDAWNATCVPPWDRPGLERKLSEVRGKSRKTPGYLLDKRPAILVTPREHEVVDQAAAAFSASDKVDIYQRGGMLCELYHRPQAPKVATQLNPGLAIKVINEPRALDLASRAMRFQELKKEKGEGGIVGFVPVDVAPPLRIIRQLLARPEISGVRVIEAIVRAPVILPNGDVLARPGYHAESGIYFDGPGNFPGIAEQPTRDDARQAAEELLDLASDFPFYTPAHRAAFLAMALTPAARPAIDGPTPLMAIDANVRGSGKSKLADCVGCIHLGQELARNAFTPDDDEMRKRLTSITLAGDPIALLDNVAGTLGCPSLDAMLTSSVWKDRVLGQSEMTAELPARTLWIATGNNLTFAADTARRALHIRLQSHEENPEERTGFKYPNLLAHVRQHRARLAVDAVTILRAYHCAGRPDMGLPPWGSYEPWSDLIRNAIVWIGLPDPGETRQQVREESDREAALLRQLLNGWEAADPYGHGLTVADAIQRAAEGCHELQAAFSELTPPGKPVSTRSVGMKLHHLRGRVCEGRYFERRQAKIVVWAVFNTSGEGFSGGTSGTIGTISSPFAYTRTPAHAHTHAHAPARKPPESSPASPSSPATACDHQNPSKWITRDRGSYCPGCNKFMGYLRAPT